MNLGVASEQWNIDAKYAHTQKIIFCTVYVYSYVKISQMLIILRKY